MIGNIAAVVTPAGHAVVLADDAGKGSPIGLLVVLILLIAVYFLYRSMSKHLKRVPPSFDPPESSANGDEPTTGPASTGR
jgi:hypothetical protein